MRNRRESDRARPLGFVLGALSLLVAVPLGGQSTCSRGLPAFGSLGVGEFHCVGGSCSINMRTGDPYAHSFSTEPRLRDIDGDGPGAGILREGDILVAVDGSLITSAEGGRKLGSLRPGQDVELTLRRDGREIHAWLQAESSCELPRLEVSSGTGLTGHALSWGYVVPDSLAWPTPADSVWGQGTAWARPLYTLSDSAGLSFGIATHPLEWSYSTLDESGVLHQGQLGPGLGFQGSRPRIEFGLELTCGDCGWRGAGAGLRFVTDVFPLIESVEKDGPADRAGLLAGDILLTVGGVAITSTEAGRALGALEAGEMVSLEIRRGDRILEISIEPREATTRRQRM